MKTKNMVVPVNLDKLTEMVKQVAEDSKALATPGTDIIVQPVGGQYLEQRAVKVYEMQPSGLGYLEYVSLKMTVHNETSSKIIILISDPSDPKSSGFANLLVAHLEQASK
jgi:uncharacterized protein YajQ (UPF0234 family)